MQVQIHSGPSRQISCPGINDVYTDGQGCGGLGTELCGQELITAKHQLEASGQEEGEVSEGSLMVQGVGLRASGCTRMSYLALHGP